MINLRVSEECRVGWHKLALELGFKYNNQGGLSEFAEAIGRAKLSDIGGRKILVLPIDINSD